MPNPIKLMMGAAGAGSENTFMWGTGGVYPGAVIGDGTVVARSSPVLSASGLNWTAFGMSYGMAAGVSGGKLYTWGNSGFGAMGDGQTTIDYSVPTQVGSLTDWVTPMDGGSDGQYWSGCVKTDGTLWMWGRQYSAGPLGDGTSIDRSSPVQIGSLTNWSKLYSGDDTSFAIKTDGTMWIFGKGGDWSSGTGVAELDSSSPVQIGSATNWVQFSSGLKRCGAVDTDGKLWTWGTGGDGLLGHGNVDNQATPLQVGSLTDWANVSMAGGQSTCAVKTDGTLWGWGRGYFGTQGHGDVVNRSSPVQVGSLTNWSKVAAGEQHMAALKTDGTIWGWGNSFGGRIGNDSALLFSSPIQIGSGTDWTDVICSKNENTLWLGPKA